MAPSITNETKLMLYKTSPDMADKYSLIGPWTGWVFSTDDLQRTFKEFNVQGVRFVEELKQPSWGGFEAQIVDPDGNILIGGTTRT